VTYAPSWPAVISQKTYPGHDPNPRDSSPDWDDCWVVATVWAAVASQPDIHRPTIPEYRKHAGDPDDGIFDGGSLDEVIRGARGSWPDLDVTRWDGAWDAFAALVKAGRPASLAVLSAKLPARLRFGFLGAHQVGIAWTGTTFVVANPLAKDGSAPLPATADELRTAALALPYGGKVRAAVFPAPAQLPDTSTEEPMYSVPGIVSRRAPKGTPYYASASDPNPKGTTGSGARYLLLEQDKPENPTRYRVNGNYLHGGSTRVSWMPASALTDPQDESYNAGIAAAVRAAEGVKRS
jgi:hypothetical protein